MPAEKEAIAAKQLQAGEEDSDLLRAAEYRLQACIGQLDGRTAGSTRDRAAERRAHGFGSGRIFDEVRGEQVYGDPPRAPKPSGC